MSNTNKVSPPVGICRACIDNPNNTFLHRASGSVIVSYCDHNKTAGILQLATDPPSWTLYTPFDRERWFDTVNSAAVEVFNQQSKGLS